MQTGVCISTAPSQDSAQALSSSCSDLWEGLNEQQMSASLTLRSLPAFPVPRAADPNWESRLPLVPASSGPPGSSLGRGQGRRLSAQGTARRGGDFGQGRGRALLQRTALTPCGGGPVFSGLLIFKRGPRFGYFRKRHWHLFQKARSSLFQTAWRGVGGGGQGGILPHSLAPLPREQEGTAGSTLREA